MSVTSNLAVTANDAISGGYTYFGGADALACVGTDDGATSYILFDASGNGAVTLDVANVATSLSILSVTVAGKYLSPGPGATGTGQEIVKIGGTSYYSNSHALNDSSFGSSWSTNPATGLPWTNADVNALKVGFLWTPNNPAGSELQLRYIYVIVSRIPPSSTVDVTRHIGSVALWMRKRPEAFLTFKGNLDLLNLNLLDAVDLEHTAGPHATGLGWEDEVWQRRPFSVHEMSIDLNTMRVSARLKDQRSIRCLVRDLAWSDKASGALGDGIARFATPGAVFTHTRASEHSFTNPVGETEVATVDVPAYGLGGLYMLSASGGRAAPRYYVTNNSTARTLSAAQGSFQCEVNLAAVSAVANQTVAYCPHDADNWWWLYWDPITATDRWVLEVRAAGTTYRAILPATPSPDTWYQIGGRWTGSNGENGDAPFTLSIFVDRVKGTDAVAGAAMSEVASSNFDFGSKAAAGTDQLNGQIRKIHSYQDVLTDTEMMRAI